MDFTEFDKLREQHGRSMYRLALKHAIEMVKIDAELGLAKLEDELKELEMDEKPCEHLNFNDYFEQCDDCGMVLEDMPEDVQKAYRAQFEEEG